MNDSTRRSFLKASGLGIAGLAIGQSASWAQAISDQILLTVFLRGGADGMSLLHPRPGTGAARTRYETWRGGGTRIGATAPLLGRLGMHPALEPLRGALNRGHATLVGGVAGAQQNRSHFHQMDLVESGAGPVGAPLRDGVYGRALTELSLADDSLARLALNTQAPFLLRSGASSGLSTPSIRRFGTLRATGVRTAADHTLQDRLDNLFLQSSNCTASVFCRTGSQAHDAVGTVDTLRAAAALPNNAGTSLPNLLSDLAALAAEDTANVFKFVTVDVGGWDSHLNQGTDVQSGTVFNGDLAKKLNGLASAIAGFYEAARAAGTWSRFTVLVLTEFGRTTRENGTGGTDHGFGGTALVMGSNLRARALAHQYFPNNTNHSFYAEAESTNALPRSLEHRQLFHEILGRRFGLSNAAMSRVLPGFTPDAAVPTLFT